MWDDPKDVIEFAIRSAFQLPKEKTTRNGEARIGSSRRNARIWPWPYTRIAG